MQKKRGGCLSNSIVIESYHVFCDILADLLQLEEFYLAVDKTHIDSLLTSLTASAEKLKETQSPFWKMPLLSQCNTFAGINRNLSFITHVVPTLWTLYSGGDSVALCTST